MSALVNGRAGAPSAEKAALNKRLDTIGWASLLILTGIIWMAPKGLVPEGVWLVGFGLILLGANVARRLNGIAVSGFGIALGVLALAMGGADLAGSVLGRALDLPVFAVWLVAVGVVVLARELSANANR